MAMNQPDAATMDQMIAPAQASGSVISETPKRATSIPIKTRTRDTNVPIASTVNLRHGIDSLISSHGGPMNQSSSALTVLPTW